MSSTTGIRVTSRVASPSRKAAKKAPKAASDPWPSSMDTLGALRMESNVKGFSEKTFGSKDTSSTGVTDHSWGGDSFDSLPWEDIQEVSKPSPTRAALSSASSMSSPGSKANKLREKGGKRQDTEASTRVVVLHERRMETLEIKHARANDTEWPPAADLFSDTTTTTTTKETKSKKKSSSKQKKESNSLEKKSCKKKTEPSISPASKTTSEPFTTPFSPEKSPARSAMKINRQPSQHKVEFALPPIALPFDSLSDDGMSGPTVKVINSTAQQHRKPKLSKASASMPLLQGKDDDSNIAQMTPRTRKARMLGKHPSMSLAMDGHGPSLHSVFCWGGDRPAKHNDLPSGNFVVTQLVTKREAIIKTKSSTALAAQIPPTPLLANKRLSNRALHAQFYERTMGQTPQAKVELVSGQGITAAQMLNIMEPCSLREVLAFNGFQRPVEQHSDTQVNYSDILDNISVCSSADASRDGNGNVVMGQRFEEPRRPNNDPYRRRDSH